jgi:tetratricopeptide (TPR) repeat protein
VEICRPLCPAKKPEVAHCIRLNHRSRRMFLPVLCFTLAATGLARAQVSELHLQNPEIAPPTANLPADQVLNSVAAARKAIQENPNSAHAYLSLSVALRSGGDLAGALDAVNQALKLDPHLSRAWLVKGLIANEWLAKGRAADEKGILREAAADFRKAVEADPQNTPARLELASILFTKGEFNAVRTQLEAILRLDPGNPNALNGIGLLQLQNGDLREAAESFRQAILHRPHFPEAQMNLGNALLQLGDWSGAREAFQNALQDEPNDAMAVYGLARALRNLGEAAPARAKFAQAKSLIEKQTAQLRANGENNRGLKLWHDGNLTGAAAAFRSALAEDPDFADAHNNLGGVLWQLNDKKNARGEFEAAVHDLPNFPKAHNNLGNALEDSGDLAGAIREFRIATLQQPAFATAHFNLGMALLRTGQRKDAEDEFRQAVLLDPGMAAAHLELGLQMISNAGPLSTVAKSEIEKGVQLNPALIMSVPEPVLHALAMADQVIAPESP